jgi:hypothetical protein
MTNVQNENAIDGIYCQLRMYLSLVDKNKNIADMSASSVAFVVEQLPVLL